MKTTQILFLSGVLLLLLGGCNNLQDPITSTQDSLAAADDPIQGQDENETDQEISEKDVVVESFTLTTSENQRAVILAWSDDSKITYTIVRADNSDCNPLTSQGCIGEVRVPNLVGSEYIDETIEQGAVYYYWLIAHIKSTDNQGGFQVASAESSPVDQQQAYISAAKRISVPVVDDLDSYIPEQPSAFFPQNLLLSQANNAVIADWSYSTRYRVGVYAGNDPDCDLAPLVHTQQQEDSVACAKLVGEGSTPPLRIDTAEEDSAYLWAVITTSTGASISGGISANSHRVVGPYALPAPAGPDNDNHVTLLERTTSSEHSLEMRFQQSNRYLEDNVRYTLVVIHSLNPVDFAQVSSSLDQLRANHNQEPKAADIASRLGSYGQIQAKVFTADNFVRAGDTLSYTVDVAPAGWYSVFVGASDGISTQTYQPAALRTAHRISVHVKGTYGLWRVKHQDEIQLALRKSGNFYPGLLDWRHISIDAKMALPDKHTYYFTGCPFYADKAGVTGDASLTDNVCQFAKQDENGNLVAPFSHPVKVNISFEHKTTSAACSNSIRVINTEYQRNRFSQVDNDQPLLCDYRNITPGSDEAPNYYTFVNPNNAPASLAQGKVDMWHGGTQAPIFLSGESSLPAYPDGTSSNTVCSDFSPNGDKCDWSAEAQVVRCNGYYAYQLPEPPGCSMAYVLEEDNISAVHRNNIHR